MANSRGLFSLRLFLNVHILLAIHAKITETVTEMILAVNDLSPGRSMGSE